MTEPVLTDGMYDFLVNVWQRADERVFPWRLPKDCELPAVTYQFIPASGPVRVHSDAHTDTPVESLFERRRMQWDVWGRTYRECEEVGRSLRHALHAFRGDMGGIDIGSIHIDIELDSYEEEVGVYRRVMDGMIRYNGIIAVAS